MPNNPRREARVAAREVRKDERREKRQGKAYASFLKEGERSKKQLEKKRTPAEIKQLIDEIPPGMRTPWMNSYGTPTTTTPPSTMRNGGAKTKLKTAMYGKSMMKKGGLKKANNGTVIKSGMPSVAKSFGAAKDLYDSDPSVRTYTNEFTGAKIPTGPMTKEEYNNAVERAGVTRAKALGAGPTMRRGGMTKTKYMTGGMVNSNAKVNALKSAGSKGVKSGVNPKAKASTTAKGKTGGTSKAPTKATPTKNKRK